MNVLEGGRARRPEYRRIVQLVILLAIVGATVIVVGAILAAIALVEALA